MTQERIVRLVAGTFVLTSVILTFAVSRWWLLLGLFVGANLFQSSLTRWCLLERILCKAGVKSDADLAVEKAKGERDAPSGLAKVGEKAA